MLKATSAIHGLNKSISAIEERHVDFSLYSENMGNVKVEESPPGDISI